MPADGYRDWTESKALESFDYPVYRRAFGLQFLLHRFDGIVQGLLATAKLKQALGSLPHLSALELLYLRHGRIVGEMNPVTE